MMSDVMTILFLVFMEGVLSIDNALVLAIMVRHLPVLEQSKALTYGIWGAITFRIGSLFILNLLIENTWVKLAGGLYLLYIAFRHFIVGEDSDDPSTKGGSFIQTIVTVELMDIAFSADSILAAVAVSPKYSIVLAGGILGIIMMRYAATLFIKLLARFPGFENTAYLLIINIGLKLVVEGFRYHFNPLVFWGLMGICIGLGFINKPTTKPCCPTLNSNT